MSEAEPGSMVTRHLLILGRVQGVFYRNWAVDTAKGFGLKGWVRNRVNGTVEAVVQGEAEAVERFIERAHEGPPAAEVAQVEVRDATPGDFEGFIKRATA